MWRSIEENLQYIKKSNCIKKIQLYKAYDYPRTNLVYDTIEITDPYDIESIQQMINDRYQGTWNRPVQSWSVAMKLILDNQKTIDIKVSKIANDKSPDMTHLYFGFNHCSDPFPNCSEKLGDFLEELTSYSGENW